jgi:hypothetical protein
MATTLREKLASLPIERREKIEAKAQQLDCGRNVFAVATQGETAHSGEGC